MLKCQTVCRFNDQWLQFTQLRKKACHCVSEYNKTSKQISVCYTSYWTC